MGIFDKIIESVADAIEPVTDVISNQFLRENDPKVMAKFYEAPIEETIGIISNEDAAEALAQINEIEMCECGDEGFAVDLLEVVDYVETMEDVSCCTSDW